MPLSDEWSEYRRMAVPPDAHRNQVTETHKAFYAGAFAMLNVITKAGAAGLVEAERDIHQFLRDFKIENNLGGDES